MVLSVFVFVFHVLLLHGINCTEFEVGDTNNLTKGWEVPPLNHPHVYNQWAQNNRFKVNDTLHFTYKKDSVMVVTESEYDKCRSSQPLYFSNNGDTTVVLDRPGLFFIMSGVTGHCERGQKMIVKVLDVQTPPQPHHNNAALRLAQMKPIMIGYFILYFIKLFIAL
ncbi:unnamed protein product [Amaranthus hypochondriacus]